MNLSAGGTVRIDGSLGDVNVEGWERPDVEITVTKTTEYSASPKEREKALALLNLYQATAQNSSGSEVTISTKLPSRSLTRPMRGRSDVEMEYQIHMPRDAKLVIRHSTGQLVIVNLNADIDATAREGDILVMLPDSGAYSIDAKSQMGGVFSDLAGADRRLHWISEQLTNESPAPSHKIRLRMGVGGITIQRLTPRNWMAGN